MKKLLIAFMFLLILACKKEKNDINLSSNYDVSNATLISQATFTSGAHTTSGSIKLYSKNGVKTLVFENFKTDSGPDLQVFLSKSTSRVNALEIGELKATSGNFSYDINNSYNTDENNMTIIWCEDYSVLFGSAHLR